MKRWESSTRKKERNKISDIAKQPSTSILEEDDSTLTKLLAGKSYDKDDIIKHAKNLLAKYNQLDQQFILIENIQSFDIEVVTEKPLFVIFGKPKNRWVLFCLIQDKTGRNIILYKDPCGARVPFKLEQKLQEKIQNLVFIVQTQKDQEVEDVGSYGPLTLRNLNKMLELFKGDPVYLVEKFPEIQFSRLTDLNDSKFSKVITLTNDLSENEKFKTVLREFIDKLPLSLGSDMIKYKKVMEEELEKDEDKVDFNRIKMAREKYLNEGNIKKFQDNYQMNKEVVDEEVKEYQLDIQKKFPEEMKKLSNIFEVLDTIKIDKQLFAALENISEVLNIDYNKMKSFYEFKLKLDDKNEEEILFPDDIKKIVANLPTIKEALVSDCSSLDQLLSEITLGMDGNSTSQEEIDKFKSKYDLIKTKYNNWENSDITAINSWAKQVKGHLRTSDEEICETISIMDRALYILTGGHRLRDTQILAVLIFFHQNHQGRLCQIKTGEGKTVIVSLLAVIKALQGHTIDIITSNPLLAADGVNETRTFYSTFNLTVSTNNPAEDANNNESKIGYSADILYGTISNFQFDFLKDSFEGFTIRKERPFGQVILDEVDSMLVDNGGHIAKLASPYPGMESLRYIYIKIWLELHKAEESFVEETHKKIEDLRRLDDKNEAKIQYEKFIRERIYSERQIIKDKIKASNPTNVPLIPAHLKDYVENKLDVWIKNALHAKYNCHEHQQYRIMTNDSGEKVVTPVDYLNTGVTLKNTIWSNGLHQFVQLKHNIHLTFESLTSSFISNIGYIKNYKDKNIFGLTGTLGSRSEQELLSQIYNINYAKLPTYKQKKFEELPGLISDDDKWATQVTLEVLEKIDDARAVLVIFETEQDLLTVKKNLEILQSNFRIRMYANEDNASETREKVRIGDVILAINIAGRGTNFRTETDLEANGGLHICVGFLPCNLRVEGQAFGRTSRQGNNGTAQLIIRRSEVEELAIPEPNPDFNKIKNERDRLEKERLEEINNVLVKELNFKDELFGYFSEFHRNLKREKLTTSYRFILQDLKEFWAFWLEKNDFNIKNIVNKTPKLEFENFLKKSKTIIDGIISHNPFYCISLADHYLDKDERGKATSALKHAIEMGGEQNYELLAGAHLKLFEVAIANGEQVKERFKKAVAKIFFVDIQKTDDYKNEAVKHLDHAKAAITREIEYIERYLTIEKNPDLHKVLTKNQNENLFLKHIHSRFYCLKVHLGNIENLRELIAKSSVGLDINGKAPTSIENFKKIGSSELKVTNLELIELQSIGIDAIYSLKEIHDVSNVVIHTAQGQSLGGISALVIGLCFLPIFPLTSTISGTLISEGIIDIVMELINQGNSEFNEKDFMKGKFISYGISLITFGISAITQSVRILTKAVSFCRKLSTFLRKSTYLKSLCNTFANLVDRLGDVLEKMLAVAKFNKLSEADQLSELTHLKETGNLDKFEHLGGLNKLEDLQKIGNLRELTRSELILKFADDLTLTTTKELAKSIVEQEVIKPLLSSVFKGIIDRIKTFFKNCLRSSIKNSEELVGKLRSTPPRKINEAVDDFTETDEAKDTAKEVGSELLGLFNNTVVNTLILIYDTVESTVKFDRYINRFVPYLNQKLQGGDSKNDAEEIIEEICDKLTDLLFVLFCDMLKGQLTGLQMSIGWVLEDNLKKVGETEGSVIISSKSESLQIKEDPYKILGLAPNVLLAEIRRQYRRMALLIHPDKNPNDPSTTEKFQKLLNAYEEIVKIKINCN